MKDIDYLLLTAIALLLTLMWAVSGCHQLIWRPPVETDRRKAEVRMLEAQAKVWEACAFQVARGLDCKALGVESPVTIKREPDAKSPISLDMPFF